MHLAPLDLLSGPPSLTSSSSLSASNSQPVTPGDTAPLSLSAKDKDRDGTQTDVSYFKDEGAGGATNASERRPIEPQPSKSALKGRAKHLLSQLNMNVSALALRPGSSSNSTELAVFSPVEDTQSPSSAFDTSSAAGWDMLESTQPGPVPSLFTHPNMPFHPTLSRLPSFNERSDTLPLARSPSLPSTIPSLALQADDGVEETRALDNHVAASKDEEKHDQDQVSSHKATNEEGNRTSALPASTTAFLADLASTLGIPSITTHAPGFAPPPNSVANSVQASPNMTTPVDPAGAHTATAVTSAGSPTEREDVRAGSQDNDLNPMENVRMERSVIADVPCPLPIPLSACENADVSSTEAVLGEEDVDEVVNEVEDKDDEDSDVLHERGSVVVEALSDASTALLRFSALQDADASSTEAISGQEQEQEEEQEEEDARSQAQSVLDVTAASPSTSEAACADFPFSTSQTSIETFATAKEYTAAVLPLARQDAMEGALDDVDARSVEAVLGREDAAAMERSPGSEIADVDEDEEDDIDTTDSIVFTLDASLALFPPSVPSGRSARVEDPTSLTAHLTESDSPWTDLRTRGWTRSDAVRALLFLPWCAVVGAMICLYPRNVGGLVFRTSAEDKTWMALLPRAHAPSSPVRRLAHHGHTAPGHVACFVCVLVVGAWFFPTAGLGIALSVGARVLRVWGGFEVGRAVRKGMASAGTGVGGGVGWMDVACVGAVLGGLEEEFVRALVVEGR